MPLLETLSTKYAKALLQGNSQANVFATFTNSTMAPSGDGVWAAGHDGGIAPNRLVLSPYALGAPGANFSLRLYAWRNLSLRDEAPLLGFWVPHLLLELSCTTSTQNGFSNAAILDCEYLCDTITLTQGNTGPWYTEISSLGNNFIAFALVDLLGCRYFQFDFQQTDPVSMNCLWARV